MAPRKLSVMVAQQVRPARSSLRGARADCALTLQGGPQATGSQDALVRRPLQRAARGRDGRLQALRRSVGLPGPLGPPRRSGAVRAHFPGRRRGCRRQRTCRRWCRRCWQSRWRRSWTAAARASSAQSSPTIGAAPSRHHCLLGQGCDRPSPPLDALRRSALIWRARGSAATQNAE